jgi:N-acetylmuramoyl-L-alanine amidase
MRKGFALIVGMAVLVGDATGQGETSLRGRTVAIDAGHNGGNARHATEISRLVDAGTLRKACDTVGTRTPSGYSEAAHNLDVALRLAAVLRRAGARVVLTRRTNTGWGPCITRRAAIGNRARADVAISIHADGGPAGGRGFHVIHPAAVRGLTDDIAAPSHRLALALRNAYRAGTRMAPATYVGRAGLARRSDLGGLNLSDVPKVFLEAGNMRNRADARLLSSPAFRQREADAIARGLAAFLRR